MIVCARFAEYPSQASNMSVISNDLDYRLVPQTCVNSDPSTNSNVYFEGYGEWNRRTEVIFDPAL
jgi:hypothetical protein